MYFRPSDSFARLSTGLEGGGESFFSRNVSATFFLFFGDRKLSLVFVVKASIS
jgi:hypothetical protein